MGCGSSTGSALPSHDELRDWLRRGLQRAHDIEEACGRDGLISVEAFEGDVIRLPGGGAVMEIVEASYGHASDSQVRVDVLPIVRERLKLGPATVGGSSGSTAAAPAGRCLLEIPVSPSIFGVPLPGRTPCLRLKYKPSNEPILVEVAEFGTLHLPAEVVDGVAEASYGAGEAWADVRPVVTRLLLVGRPVTVRSEMLRADPCPGVPKVLRVRYLPRHRTRLRVRLPDRTAQQALVMDLLAPEQFREVRKLLSVGTADFFRSVSNPGRVGTRLHRAANEALYYTQDGRFALKAVPASEMATLIGMLPAYTRHLREHPDSLLARYLAGYRLTGPDGHEVCMVALTNIFEGAGRMDAVYDVRGGSEERVMKVTDGTCMTDKNFAYVTIHLDEGATEAVHSSIEADTEFLRRQQILDYSLMIGCANCKELPCSGRHSLAPELVPRLPTFRPSSRGTSKNVGGYRGIKAEGVLSGCSMDCEVYLGIVNDLVAHGLRFGLPSTGSAFATASRVDEAGLLLPAAYALRFRECFRRKIRARSEHITLTPVAPSVFEMPLQPLGRSGGTAAFFTMRYVAGAKAQQANVSTEYWIGKDLARSRDEVVFYEAAQLLKSSPGWEMLTWMTPYGGVCRALCRRDQEIHDVDVMLLRNCRDGFKTCRMLDIKIGVRTAVAGWQGKSAFHAWRQSCIDSHTNSAGQGFRLEGFDNPPETLRTIEKHIAEGNSLKLAAKTKQLLRFNLQRMLAHEFLPLFLDLHAPTPAPEDPACLSVAEHQELVLLSCIEELASFIAACRRAPVPQQWIGSSVMLSFDSQLRPRREVLQASLRERGVATVHIFDWGRSELNTPRNHESLAPDAQAARELYWGYYCGGVAKLLYDCCCLYVGRFWHEPQSFAFSLWDKDRYSDDDFIGYVALPAVATAKRAMVLKDPSGAPVRTGIFTSKEATLEVSVAPMLLHKGSRLEGGWAAHVHNASNVPRMDYTSGTDSFAELVMLPDTPADVEAFLERNPSALRLLLHEAAHPTKVIIDSSSPVWGEGFELATLKPEARSDFLKALATAFGRDQQRPVLEAEVAALFPRTCQAVEGADRSALQRTFAQQCFPQVKVDESVETPLKMQKFPSWDVLRLAHFGGWLLREGQTKALIFVLFLLTSAKGGVARMSALSFCRAFLQTHRLSKWASDVQDLLQPLEEDTGEDSQAVQGTRRLLEQISRNELQVHWTTYEFQNQEARFYHWGAGDGEDEDGLGDLLPASAEEGGSSPAGLSSENRARTTVCLVEALQGRREEESFQEADQSVVSSVAGARPNTPQKPQDRVATAIPVMVEAIRRGDLAMDRLYEAAGTDLGLGEALCLARPQQVGRCRYLVPAGGCRFAPSPGAEAALSFEAIGSDILRDFRVNVAGLSDDLIADELGDPSKPIRALSTNSRSGEIFLISAGGRFIIKTVSDTEAKALIEILPRYLGHIRGSATSILGQYLALYRLDIGGGHGERYVTVMRSVFDTSLKMSAMYDLKGSTHHRSAKPGDSVKKDQDWINDARVLKVSKKDAANLCQAHVADTSFLSSCNVMDFSILVGIAPLAEGDGAAAAAPPGAWASKDGTECYFLGIIDFLVEYGLRKRAEHMVHELRGIGETASVTEPARYAQRQREFFAAKVLGGKPETN